MSTLTLSANRLEPHLDHTRCLFHSNMIPKVLFLGDDSQRSAFGNTLKSIWLRQHQRQETWKKVVAAEEYMTNYHLGLVSKFNESIIRWKKNSGDAQRTDNAFDDKFRQFITDLERSLFNGNFVTKGENPHLREIFWCLLEVRSKGITPSDLLTMYDVNEGYRQQLELLTKTTGAGNDPRYIEDLRYQLDRMNSIMTKEKYKPDPMNAIFHDGYNAARRVFFREVADNVRRYATLYIAQGWAEDQPATPFSPREDGLRHLQLSSHLTPEYIKGGARHDTQNWRTLNYWRYYGVERMSDIPDFPHNAKRQLMKEFIMGTAKPDELRRDKMQRLINKHRNVYEAWPLQYRPFITMVADMVVMDYVGHPKRVAAGGEIDNIERMYFGNVLTHGDPEERTEFWNYLALQHEKWMTALPAGMGNILYQSTIAVSVEGWILDGKDPNYMCRLVGRGRGGLSEPIEPELVENTDGYQTLSFWANESGWRKRKLARWLARS